MTATHNPIRSKVTEGASEQERKDSLMPSQRVHAAFNKAAAKIAPLKRLIADRELAGVDSATLRKLLHDAEREKTALEKQMPRGGSRRDNQ